MVTAQALSVSSSTGRLLTRQFGVLPPWAEARLAAAKPKELATWAEALLDAATLEDVLR